MGQASALRPAPFGATMATLIGLIATTGLRPGEARRLDRDHVDLGAGQLTVWHSKLGKSRRLPLHESAVEALVRYTTVRERWRPEPKSEAFFPGRNGTRLTAPNLASVFGGLRRAASIVPAAGRHPAVVGGLRHTFAVSTLLGWHRAGADVGRQLPVLSAFLGRLNPRNTYWYLQATPELMAIVAERLEAVTEARR